MHVYNLVILDESGSMELIKTATISGFNEIVQTMREIEKKFPDQKHFISLVSFNGSGIRTLLDRASVQSIRELNHRSYRPSSSTPLYDAMGLSITRLKYDTAGVESAGYLVTVLTDGEENASREFNASQIRALVDDLKRAGWTFTYIGANHDVEKAALTISVNNTMTFVAEPEEMKMMFDKEKRARVNYANRLQNNQAVEDSFYTQS